MQTLKELIPILQGIAEGKEWDITYGGDWLPVGCTNRNVLDFIRSGVTIRLRPLPGKWAKEKEAFKAGKQIQYKSLYGNGWVDACSPSWLDGYEYRIKPEPDKWAKEKAAFKAGQDIQWNYAEQPNDLWYSSTNPQWENPAYVYRIKPDPEYVPLGPEDVPPGSVIRGAGEIDSPGWCLITSCSNTGIRLWRHGKSEQMEITWKSLMETQTQILRPGTTKWVPCRKELPC